MCSFVQVSKAERFAPLEELYNKYPSCHPGPRQQLAVSKPTKPAMLVRHFQLALWWQGEIHREGGDIIPGIDCKELGPLSETEEEEEEEEGLEWFEITCPEDAGAGDVMTIVDGDGDKLELEIPEGVVPGETFSYRIE